MKESNNRIYLAIILASSFLMLLILNLPFKPKKFGDDIFHNEAKSLALFIKGQEPESKVVITRAPGPVLFFTIPYLIAPSDSTNDELWNYGFAFSSIVMTFALLLVFRTAKTFFSKEVGILSIFLFFLFPMHAYYSMAIIGESAAFSSVALALYGWSKVWVDPRKKSGWAYFIIGILFLILNRPNTLLIFGVVFLVLVYAWFKKRTFFEKFAKPLIVSFAIIGIFGLGTLQIAKAITAKNGIPEQSNLLSYVMFQGRFQFREEPMDLRFWDSDNRSDSKDYQNWLSNFGRLQIKAEAENRPSESVLQEFLLDDMKTHPDWFIRQFFVKIFYGNINIISSVTPENFKIGPLKGVAGYYLFMFALNAINFLILVGVGMFFIKFRNQLTYWPFWGILLALFIFHALTYMEPRYIFPAKVALNIIGAAGLYQFRWMKRIVDRTSVIFFPVKS